jgi:1-acyl-sn-glycerol-3-phosphate acyltransferase
VGPYGISLAQESAEEVVAMGRLMRFWVRAIVGLFYRLEARDVANVPVRGGAVLVCNHVGLVDALLIAASTPRPVRFVMDHRVKKWPRRLRSRVTLRCGAPVPPHDVTAASLMARVAELGESAHG